MPWPEIGPLLVQQSGSSQEAGAAEHIQQQKLTIRIITSMKSDGKTPGHSDDTLGLRGGRRGSDPTGEAVRCYQLAEGLAVPGRRERVWCQGRTVSRLWRAGRKPRSPQETRVCIGSLDTRGEEDWLSVDAPATGGL